MSHSANSLCFSRKLRFFTDHWGVSSPIRKANISGLRFHLLPSNFARVHLLRVFSGFRRNEFNIFLALGNFHNVFPSQFIGSCISVLLIKATKITLGFSIYEFDNLVRFLWKINTLGWLLELQVRKWRNMDMSDLDDLV